MVGNNLKLLRKKMKQSQDEVALQIGLTRSSYSGYENKIAEPSISTLISLSEFYNVPIDHLLKRDFSKFTESDWECIRTGVYQDVNGDQLRILAITVDTENNELIELIPQQARAGYTTGYADPEYLKVLPTFSLPFLSKEKKYRSFPITGDSMPPVSDGSYVIGEFLQNWKLIKNSTPCIIVTKEDGIVFKIVNNYIEHSQVLELCSTNPVYAPYTVHVNEIIEVWKFVNYIAKELPDLRADDQQLTQSIQNLQREVQGLKNSLIQK